MDYPVSGLEATVRTLFRRCVDCQDGAPSCPVCDEGEVCSRVSQSCTQCASTECVRLSDSGTTIEPADSNDNSTNVGAIAGGVIGGVAFIAIITFLVWRFWIRRRRQEYEESYQAEEEFPPEKSPTSLAAQRDPRASTHTVASMASSALTRASNIIQIAYIPGVTNRGPHSPDVLVPPVPPIPAESREPFSPGDQHFFVPGDLRGSTFSGTSTTDLSSGRIRASIAPSLARSSVATTVYRDNAVIDPRPAQTIVRGKAAVVSVKSSLNNSPSATPGGMTPPVPQVDYQRTYPAANGSSEASGRMPASSDNASLSGSVKSAAGSEKPNPLKIVKVNAQAKGGTEADDTVAPLNIGLRKASNASSIYSPTNGGRGPTESSTRQFGSSTGYSAILDKEEDGSSQQEPLRPQRSNLTGRDSEITEIQDTPAVSQSPFSDSSPNRLRNTPSPYLDSDSSTLRATSPALSSQRSASPRDFGAGRQGLAVVIEEATRRASRVPAAGLGSRGRDQSPFSDGHAVGRP